MFSNIAKKIPIVLNEINFAQKAPNFAYFAKKIFPEIPPKFNTGQGQAPRSRDQKIAGNCDFTYNIYSRKRNVSPCYYLLFSHYTVRR